MPTVTPVELATLVSSTGRVELGNKCEVWRGQVLTQAGKFVEAYVKHLPPRAILVECVASLIGRCLSLSIPRPLLVKVHAAQLPGIDLTHTTGGILFGSEDAEYPSLQQVVKVKDIYEKLLKWPAALEAGCFDEWIANPDRHHGNILYGGSNSFTLIDHSHAIATTQDSLKPVSQNTFLTLLAPPNNDELSRKRLLRKANQKLPDFLRLSLDEWEELTMANNYARPEHAKEIIKFLQDRLSVLSVLIGHQLGNKQQDLYVST